MTRKIPFRPAVVILLAATLLGGCAGDEPPAVVESPSPSQVAADALTEQLALTAEGYGIVSPPQVEVVRKVTLDEHSSVQAQCMADQGFPPDASGGFLAQEGQAEALHLAVYRCTAMYPLTDDFYQPWTDEQRVELYDHYVEVLVPCLREHGAVVGDPPTLTSFLETLGTETEYTPFPSQGTPEQLVALGAACPSMPEW